MKKLLIVLLFIPFLGMTQSGDNVLWKKFADANTRTADTGYIITTSADYTWMLYMTWASTTTSTTTVMLQESGDNGSTWAGVTGMATITMNTVTGVTGFQGDYSPANKVRLYIDVGSGETVILNAWYTFKTKVR